MKSLFVPEDLNQITPESLEKLRKSEVILLALRLRDFGIDLYERLNLDSSNSSKPPSSDNPYQKNEAQSDDEDGNEQSSDQVQDTGDESDDGKTPEDRIDATDPEDQPKRKPGRQPGSKGFWRTDKPETENKEHHYPKRCIICMQKLEEAALPYTAHYTYELERLPSGIEIVCTLHYYYAAVCSCGHENFEKPGEGYVSIIEGRKRNLKLTEYTIVGPMLATGLVLTSPTQR